MHLARNLPRVQIFQCVVLAGLICCCPTTFFKNIFNYEAPKDGPNSLFRWCIFQQLVLVGAVFFAVARFDSVAAQRKVLLFSSFGYFAAIVTTYLHNENGINLYLICAIHLILFVAVAVLCRTERVVLAPEEKDNSWLKIALRLMAVYQVAKMLCGYFHLCPSGQSFMLKKPEDVVTNEFHMRMIVSFKCIWVGACIAASTLSNVDMKKMAQVLMLVPVAEVVFVIQCVEHFNTAALLPIVAGCMGFLMLLAYACYPCTYETMVLRLFTCEYAYSAFFCLYRTNVYMELMNIPQLAIEAGKTPNANVTLAMTKLGLEYIPLALVFAAGLAMSSRTQKIFLWYALLGYLVAVCATYHCLGTIDCKALKLCILVLVVFKKRLPLHMIISKLNFSHGIQADIENKEKMAARRRNLNRSATPARVGLKGE